MTIKTKNRSEITLHDERRPPRRTPPGQLTEIRDEVTSPRDRRVTRPRPRRRLPRPGAAVPHRPSGPGDGPTGEEATGPLAEGVAPRPPAQSVSQSVSGVQQLQHEQACVHWRQTLGQRRDHSACSGIGPQPLSATA